MTFSDRVLDGLGPALLRQGGAVLVDLVEALTGPLQDVAASAASNGRAWPVVFDLAETPYPAALGSATGTPVPAGLTVEKQRAYVTERPGQRRGTPAAIIAAVRETLSATRTVELNERDGSPWHLTIRVFEAELPAGGAAAVKAAALTQKPYGITITIDVKVLPGAASYQHLSEEHGTYAELSVEFPTYAAMTAHRPALAGDAGPGGELIDDPDHPGFVTGYSADPLHPGFYLLDGLVPDPLASADVFLIGE